MGLQAFRVFQDFYYKCILRSVINSCPEQCPCESPGVYLAPPIAPRLSVWAAQITSVYLIAGSATPRRPRRPAPKSHRIVILRLSLPLPPPFLSETAWVFFLHPLTSFSRRNLFTFFPKHGAFKRFVREQFTFQRFVPRNAGQEGKGQNNGSWDRRSSGGRFFNACVRFWLSLVQRALKSSAITGHEFTKIPLQHCISERQTGLMRER